MRDLIFKPLAARPRTVHHVHVTRTGAVRRGARRITLAMLTRSAFGPVAAAAKRGAQEAVARRLAASQSDDAQIIAMFRAPRQDSRTRGDDAIGGDLVG